MKYRIKIPGSANFIPNATFLSDWAVWLFIRDVLGDRQIAGIKIEVIK